MISSKHTILALAVAAALSACGGGGGSNTPTSSSGVVIDGYVQGATVFCDADADGVLDAGEKTTTTDDKGAFTFSPACDATLVASGGTNIDTGFDFKGRLKAPGGSTVLTALTTLLADVPALTNAALVAQLGLPANTDLTQLDVANGKNPEAYKKTLAVQHILAQLVSATTTADGDPADQYASIAQAFGTALAGAESDKRLIGDDGALNLAFVLEVVAALPDVKALELDAADLSATVASIVDDANRFAQASDEQLADLAKELQDPERTVEVRPTTNYVYLENDLLFVNGYSTPVSEFAGQDGITIGGLSSLGVDLAVNGSPAAISTVKVGFELVEQGGDERKLQVLLDKAKLSFDANGLSKVEVPSDAKVHVYGRKADGTEINLALANLTFTPVTLTDGSFTLNYANIVDKVIEHAQGDAKTTAEAFLGITGVFTTKIGVSNLNLRTKDGAELTKIGLTVENSTACLCGVGVQGKLTIEESVTFK